MSEIKLTKRYPRSRTEDITDAYMRGYTAGRESAAHEFDELRELVRELFEDQCADGDEWKYRDRLRELGIEVEE